MAFPIGAIINWGNALGSIPSGWHLADGTAGTVNTCDLWIPGAGGVYAVGATGGTLTVNTSHTHDIGTLTAVGGTHVHDTDALLETSSGSGSGGIGVITFDGTYPAAVDHTHPTSLTALAGDPLPDGPHDHNLSGTFGGGGTGLLGTIPPTIAVYFIQRLS